MLERDPILYPNPLSFKPERWLGSSPEAERNRKHSVTFGTGSRTCLGQFIARQVLRKTLACLLYNFNISPWDAKKDSEEEYKYLSTYPRKGDEGFMYVRLEGRFAAI